MPRALVTGGAGFIGSHLAGKLLNNGWDVRVVDNLERGKIDNIDEYLAYIDFWGVDLRDSYGWCRDVDVVFHLASKVGSMDYYLRHAHDVFNTNTMIDSLVLESAIHHEVEHYVYASSAHVYPQNHQVGVREYHAIPADPLLSYGWAKLFGEKALEYAPINGVSARIEGAYGPRQDFELSTCSAIPAFIRRAILYPDVRFTVLTDGWEKRAYCYVSDVVDALFLLVGETGACNIGSGKPVTIWEIAGRVAGIAGLDADCIEFANKRAKVKEQMVSSEKIRSLGWKPKVSLDEGLRKTYNYALTREWANQG